MNVTTVKLVPCEPGCSPVFPVVSFGVLIFGHIGITISVAGLPRAVTGNAQVARWWEHVDYRLVALGSLLPDILDKSVWLLGNGQIFPSGRAFGHTILFNLVLFLAAVLLVRRRMWGMLVFSLASFMHILLDAMWTRPATLLWPFLGAMVRTEPEGLLDYLLHRLFTDPLTYIPEIAGFIIVASIGLRLLGRRRLGRFIRTGELG